MNESVVLFDGVCKFCNFWVNFAIKHDAKKKLHFSPLQSEYAKQLLQKHQVNITNLNTVIFSQNNTLYFQMDAVIMISKHLEGIGRLGVLFKILPSSLRNYFYQIIAKNRYRMWGQTPTCMVPTDDVKKRFL